MITRNAATGEMTREFEGWVLEHQAGLRAFIRALGVDEAWVDDLAQESFLVAYRRLEEFDRGTDFGKWLRSIARFLVANERRKEARHSRLLPLAVAEVLLNQGPEPDSPEPNLGQLLAAMRDCVARLPARSRELLQRRYAGGENARTIALEWHMKADAVRQTLSRIRVAVKDCIQKKGGGLRV